MKCKVCGYENTEDAAFCCSCGSKMESIEEKRICSNCGDEVEGSFCSNCGTPVAEERQETTEPEPNEIEEKKYCSNCGTEIEGQFCPNCGMPVDATNQVLESREGATDNDCKSKDGETIGRSGFKRFLHYLTIIYDVIMGIILVLALFGKFDNGVDIRLGLLILLIIPSYLFFGIMRLCENKYYEKHPYTSDLNRFTIAQIIGFSISIILLICILVAQPAQIKCVKSGYLGINENITVGEAFDRACTREKWTYFRSDHLEDIVEFSGKYNGVNVRIQFAVKGNDFDIVYAELDGEALNQIEMAILLGVMYGNIDEEDLQEMMEAMELSERNNYTLPLYCCMDRGIGYTGQMLIC